MRSAACTVESILAVLNDIAPFALSESWDNAGLQVGDPGAEVSGILIGLDPTVALLDEAGARGCDLVVTHHPLIFPHINSIRPDQPVGACIAKALAGRMAVVACHTNLDLAVQGVSQALARRLGLADLKPLAGNQDNPALGFGRLGVLPAPLAGVDFLRTLGRRLGLPALAVAGPLPERIERVAVCGGSGSEFASLARDRGAQVFVTAEVKHHVARWAEETGFCVIDAGHFHTERLIVGELAAVLAESLARRALSLPVLTTGQQGSPFSFFTGENVLATHTT